VREVERTGAQLVVDLVGVALERFAIGGQEEHLAAVEELQVRRERHPRDVVVDVLAQQVLLLEQLEDDLDNRGSRGSGAGTAAPGSELTAGVTWDESRLVGALPEQAASAMQATRTRRVRICTRAI